MKLEKFVFGILLYLPTFFISNLAFSQAKNRPQSIPPTIHYVWAGSFIPEKYRTYIVQTKEQNPLWRITLWIHSDFLTQEQFDDTIRFAQANHIDLKSITEALGGDFFEIFEAIFTSKYKNKLKLDAQLEFLNYAYFSDIIRYGVVSKYGGLYMDVKTLLSQRMPPLVANHDGILLRGTVNLPDAANTNGEYINNDYFAAAVNAPVISQAYSTAIVNTAKMIQFENGLIQLTYPTYGNRGLHTFANTGAVHLTRIYANNKGMSVHHLRESIYFHNLLNHTKPGHGSSIHLNQSNSPLQPVGIFPTGISRLFQVPNYNLSWASKRDSFLNWIKEVETAQARQLEEIEKKINLIHTSDLRNFLSSIVLNPGGHLGDRLYNIERISSELLTTLNTQFYAANQCQDIDFSLNELNQIDENLLTSIQALSLPEEHILPVIKLQAKRICQSLKEPFESIELPTEIIEEMARMDNNGEKCDYYRNI